MFVIISNAKYFLPVRRREEPIVLFSDIECSEPEQHITIKKPSNDIDGYHMDVYVGRGLFHLEELPVIPRSAIPEIKIKG